MIQQTFIVPEYEIGRNVFEIAINYETHDGAVYIEDVFFDFDGRWVKVPPKWREKNLDELEQIIIDHLEDLAAQAKMDKAELDYQLRR